MSFFGARSFRHGVHPEEHKDQTAHLETERMAFVPRYELLLGQHGGKPSVPVVHPGQKVVRGQLLARADGFVSTSLHSPVSGTVRSLDRCRHPNGSLVPAIEIEADPFSAQTWPEPKPTDPSTLDNDQFVEFVQSMGIVGMGGAAFPAHVKYKLSPDKPAQKLIINGCECEPYLTCDHRVMVEFAERVVRGIRILADNLRIPEVHVGIEKNKPDAVAAMREAARGDERIRIVDLVVKYPQGAEKMLIKALLGEEVPAGRLPLEVGALVNNVGTMVAIADAFDLGRPLVERVVTIAGPNVGRPSNLIVPIGTPVRDVLDTCGGLNAETREVVMGGPMMGQPMISLDAPVLKGTSGLLAFPQTQLDRAAEYTCLKCGRCVEACPAFLNPSKLVRLAKVRRYEEMEQAYVMDCMECGSCSYACPSNIPIVQLIRVSKSSLRGKKRG